MQVQGLVSRVATVTGGGAHSAEWLQIIADVLDVEVKLAKHDEAAAFGAALQALWCYRRSRGHAAAIADVISSHLEFGGQLNLKPNKQRVSTYSEAFRRYQDLVIMMQARWAN
jgi:xylulokinase